MLVRKKNGDIRICLDFRNMNKCSLKDNYLLPKMDHLVQKVVGANQISMIDGYSGYNQIVVNKDDQTKTTFTTPWGTFMYCKIPFSLTNVSATFQRAMDIAFEGERDRFVVVYLDDIIVFSKSDKEHLTHLRQAFDKSRKYGLPLNLKKSLFVMEEGRLLGHIVTSQGICIDSERVEAIQKVNLPRNRKEIQSFLGKVNFLRCFIPNFSEIVKNITSMLRKYQEIKCNTEAKDSFVAIKLSLIEALVLDSPNFSQDFMTFSFASDETIAAVLLQKNSKGFEQPISFFNRALRDA